VRTLRFPGRIQQRGDPRQVRRCALPVVLAESDGGRDRRFPLGDSRRQRDAASGVAGAVLHSFGGILAARNSVFPPARAPLCGHGLTGAPALSDVVIEVEGLGKRYLLGRQQERYLALRDVASEWAVAFGRRLLGRAVPPQPDEEEFWALRQVSFQLNRGEVLGVIGRNGAGKSTLLKILSRITEPTEGRMEIHGRLGSLLEVGTGFHPELTGRENIFLNGTILGMKRREVSRKFDEIVDFSGIEQFLDTPVKRYSSGMYVRLAFAVAAHLEPEILVVDEVLAVGDVEFQKKCLGKMSQVAGEGRTILFVSHSMGAIKTLCSRAMLINHGTVDTNGSVEETVAAYLNLNSPIQAHGMIADNAPRIGTGDALLRRVELRDCQGRPIEQLMLGQRFKIATIFEV